MSKITQEQRNRYFEKVKEYRRFIEQGVGKEKVLSDFLVKDQEGAGYKRLQLADEALNLFSGYLLVNTLSVSLLGIKNEDYLAEARKALGRAIKYIEDTVSPLVDASFSEYEKGLMEIETFSAELRYRLLMKLGFAIHELEDAYGSNSKWKWSFVEVWGKFATVSKNLLNLKGINLALDFESPTRQPTMMHIQLAKRLCNQAADRYREKYEVYSNKIDDFRIAILHLSALRRLTIVLGDREEAENLKRKIEIWSTKLDNDQKKAEETRR